MYIRLCKQDEIECVGSFYDSVVKYLTEHINYPKWTYLVYPSVDYVREMAALNRQYACIEDNRLVGAFVLADDAQGEYSKVRWSVNLDGKQCLVCHALAVATDLQKRGLGKEIVHYCIDFAKHHEYAAVRLDVVPTNTPARKLYESCGFTYVGDYDLERGYDNIPLFSLYELNI